MGRIHVLGCGEETFLWQADLKNNSVLKMLRDFEYPLMGRIQSAIPCKFQNCTTWLSYLCLCVSFFFFFQCALQVPLVHIIHETEEAIRKASNKKIILEDSLEKVSSKLYTSLLMGFR